MAEIITLMENGYADGAMARWRTLYEITTVATVIADAGESLAKRYVEHEAIEAKSALDEYDRCYRALGFAPYSKRERKRIEKYYSDAIDLYGKEFATPYGWAAEHLKKKRPTFADIEAASERSEMRSYYKMASYNVHAGTKGITFRLSALGDPTTLVAGASNAGFMEPGQNAAVTFTQITALLFDWRRPTFKYMIELRTLSLLRDEAVRALSRAERKLDRDTRAVAKMKKP
jgi:hypothetical protein